MALTRDFKDTIKARAQRDPAFRRGLFEEAIEAFLSNDTETGKLLLRDYVNATVGFEKLGAQLDKSPKSLMRMLSTQGNPRADNLFAVVGHLRKQEGGTFLMRPESQPTNHMS
jgi:DNA-binding phage protein